MRTTRRYGQAQVEYILLIGLVCLFIIAALFWFRDAVVGYTGRVADWIGGGGSMAQAQRPATPPPPPPSPSPTPSPSPPPDAWAGVWCYQARGSDPAPSSFENAYEYVAVGDGTYRVFIGPSGGPFRELTGTRMIPVDANTYTYEVNGVRGTILRQQADGSFSDGTWTMWRC
jgi:Flp pilus assembly pilin Flp